MFYLLTLVCLTLSGPVMLKSYTAWTSGSHWLNPLFFTCAPSGVAGIVITPACLCLPVSEMTYTVSSGTLNSTIPYHTCLSVCKIAQERVDGCWTNLVGGDKGQTSWKVKFWCRSLSGYGSVWISRFISDLEQHENDHLLVYCGETTGQMSFIPAEGG